MIQKERWYLAALVAMALIGSIASNATASEKADWSTDTAHTEINFSVSHFFTPVSGSFGDYDVDLDYDSQNPENSSVTARIQVASINTGNEKRDGHLRTGDWFEAESYPEITFKSTSVRKEGDDQLIATGPLSIKGQSREIELAITLLGTRAIPEQMQQMLGGTREVASFKASTTIDRGDFGVGVGNWAATMVVGGTVDIEILLEAHNK